MLSNESRALIERLFRRYARGVASYVLARVGDAETAEAITSGVFELVVRKIDQCRSSPEAWLWSIVRTEISRNFRGLKRTSELDPAAPDPSAGPFEQASDSEQKDQMRRALALLSDEQQELIYLKFYLDLSNGEIAVAMGATANHVGVLIYRTVKRLKALMEEMGNPPAVSERTGVKARKDWLPAARIERYGDKQIEQ